MESVERSRLMLRSSIRRGDRLLFGSELKALLAHPDCPREPDFRDIELSQGLERSHPTYVRGIEGLPGGHRLVVEAGGHVPSEFHRHMLMRIAILQRYNLWHEDRTSSAQGIEARVPFLDHRLVELLASIPPAQHESLFFDKRIVREQLARAAPFYPRDKLKVKFFETGRGRSIRGLRLDVALRVYPAFRAKYFDFPDPVFSRDRLDTHYRHILGSSDPAETDVRDFLECMAIEIFTRMCATLHTAGPPAGVDPPSPLSAERL